MRPVTATVGPLAAASATNIRTASAVGGAGAVTLNGTLVGVAFYKPPQSLDKIPVLAGQALLDKPRRILITSAGNDSGITFTLAGLDVAGNPITEILTGANASTVQSLLDYAVLQTVTASGASAGNVSIGTSGVASSPWIRLDDWPPGQVGLQIDVSGTVNYTVSQSMDDPNDPTNPVNPQNMTWVNSSDANVVGATTAQQSNYNFAPRFVRVTLNSGSGSATLTAVQYGVNPA